MEWSYFELPNLIVIISSGIKRKRVILPNSQGRSVPVKANFRGMSRVRS